MLVQFSVSNYKSFNNEVILNMTPAKSRIMKKHIITDENNKSIDILPLVAIYGANASGKTNLINAIRFMKDKIINGTNTNELTGVIPYRLEANNKTNPSKFEIIFKYEGILYTYGFLMSNDLIHEEWLFGYFSSQESLIFERITKNDKIVVKTGNRLKKSKFINYIAQGTRPSQLFLTEAYSKNIKVLNPIIEWFNKCLHIVKPDSVYSALIPRAYNDQKFIEFLSDFLSIADTGINNVKCEKEDLDLEKHLPYLPPELRLDLLENLSKKSMKTLLVNPNAAVAIKNKNQNTDQLEILHLETGHLTQDGNIVYFNTEDESDGTKRLMHLAPILLDILENKGNIFLIDELDRSLHTLLSKLILETFLNVIETTKVKGQIIFTTHDTNLLDRELLRKDEIIFLEKDNNGASHISSLSEFKISDGLNYQNGYLNGRFGAIPFIGDIEKLLH